jgi:hypothetical protein
MRTVENAEQPNLAEIARLWEFGIDPDDPY